MNQSRSLVVAASGYSTRIETFEGREHLVVPVVALVEGVMFAMNAPAPELVTAEEFSRAPGGWNGRPIFEGHPLKNGQPVSGNIPEVLETKRIGIVFNAGIKKNKLVMEAWLDIETCKERAPLLLERAQTGDDIEISVGVFVDKDESSGTFAGKQYKGAWKDIVPDHLALLVDGDEGACSRKAGCGVRAASKGETVKVVKPSLIARLGQLFRGAQPAEDMTQRDLETKLVQALRQEEPYFDWIVTTAPAMTPNRVIYQVYVPGQAPDYVANYVMFERAFSLADNGEVTVNDARIEVEAVTYYEPVLMNEEVPGAHDAGALFPPVPDRPNETNPNLADLAGKRHSTKDEKMIQAMHDHAIALGATCSPTAMSSGASAETQPEPNQETEDMKLEDIVTFLGTATDCDKKALRTALGVETPVVAPVVEPVAPAKTPTFAELLEAADPTVRAAISEGVRVAGERKAATIKALKDSGRNAFTDEQLGAMDQAQLDNLAKLAQVQAVSAPVDFRAQGTPKNTEDKQVVPAAPDMAAGIRAARGQK